MSDLPDTIVVNGRQYVAGPGLSQTTDLKIDTWIPAVGDIVWSNFDSGPPMGKVIGYLDDPGKPRHGQPVIEATEDDKGMFAARKKGDQFICHPAFMWPFEPGSEENKAARESGRIR